MSRQGETPNVITEAQQVSRNFLIKSLLWMDFLAIEPCGTMSRLSGWSELQERGGKCKFAVESCFPIEARSISLSTRFEVGKLHSIPTYTLSSPCTSKMRYAINFQLVSFTQSIGKELSKRHGTTQSERLGGSITWTQRDADENRCDPGCLGLARLEVVQELDVKNAERVGDAVSCWRKQKQKH